MGRPIQTKQLCINHTWAFVNSRNNQRSLFHSPTPAFRRLSRRLKSPWRTLNTIPCRSHQVGGDTRNNTGVKFPLFTSVLLFQSGYFLLTHILAAEVLDLIHDMQQDRFWTAVSLCCMFHLLNISSCDIRSALNREGYNITKFLPPA